MTFLITIMSIRKYCDLAQNGNIVAIFVEVRRFTANQESEGSEVWGGVIGLYWASPEFNFISTARFWKNLKAFFQNFHFLKLQESWSFDLETSGILKFWSQNFRNPEVLHDLEIMIYKDVTESLKFLQFFLWDKNVCLIGVWTYFLYKVQILVRNQNIV